MTTLDGLVVQFPDKAGKLRGAQRLLASDSSANRSEGVRRLAACGEEDDEIATLIFPVLIDYLRDPDSEVRSSAEYGLDNLGVPSFKRLLSILGDCPSGDAQFESHLIRALGHFHYKRASAGLWKGANQQLRRWLDHDSPTIRGAVALTMAELGEASPEFIDRLTSMSHSSNDDERRGAVKGLKQIAENQPDIRRALQPLFLQTLGDADGEIRESVAWALCECGSEVLPDLLLRLDDVNSAVREHVLTTFSRFYNSTPREAKLNVARRILMFLEDANKNVRKAAAFAVVDYLYWDENEVRREAWSSRAIRRLKDLFMPSRRERDKVAAAAVDRLIEMCKANDADERAEALHALSYLGAQSPKEQLAKARHVVDDNTKHPVAEVRKWAYTAWRYFGATTEDVIQRLQHGIDDESCDVAGTAANELKELQAGGADVSTAIPALCRVLDRRNCDAAHAVYLPFEPACEILSRFPPATVWAAIPALERSLNSPSATVIGAASVALGKIGQRVDKSLPRLKELLDEGEMLGESFCDVIATIGPAAGPLVNDVLRLLDKPDWDTQWAAADALGAVASSDDRCIAALIRGLQHPSGIVRGACVRSFSKVGQAAVPRLIQCLQEDDEAKEMAADALGVIGKDAQAAVAHLVRLLKSSDEGVRDWSAIALGKITTSAEFLPQLISILRLREGPNIRANTAEALGAIGPSARTALPLLKPMLADENEAVSTAAAEAINLIEGRKTA